MSPDIRALRRKGIDRLKAVGIDSAELDAELLLAHALGVDHMAMLVQGAGVLTATSTAAFERLIAARARSQPVAHLLGHRDFWGLSFQVSPQTLIPRPDSETLVEHILARAPGARSLLDLGTGTGALLLALLSELPAARGVGVDIVKDAVDLASANAAALGLDKRAAFYRSDWFADVPSERFDVIVCNPPYITAGEHPELMPDVRDFEPVSALIGSDSDGLGAYRHIIPAAKDRLSACGLLAFEVGVGQAQAVAQLLQASGYCNIQSARDLGGHIRVISAQMSKKPY